MDCFKQRIQRVCLYIIAIPTSKCDDTVDCTMLMYKINIDCRCTFKQSKESILLTSNQREASLTDLNNNSIGKFGKGMILSFFFKPVLTR